MNVMNLLLDQGQHTYSISMICIYLSVLMVAFIVCVIISQKLNVYTTDYKKVIKSKSHTKYNAGDELQEQALKEVAATAEDLRGAEDER